MRSITITVSDEIAEELEAEAHRSGRTIADLAGEQFAIAWNIQPALAPGGGAPFTQWQNGHPVYQRPAPPTWLQQQSPLNPPDDNTNGLHRVIGQWPGEESDEEIDAALERLS